MVHLPLNFQNIFKFKVPIDTRLILHNESESPETSPAGLDVSAQGPRY